MSTLSTLAPTTLADHELAIFYKVDGLHAGRGPHQHLSDLAGSQVFPADQASALRGRYADVRVWVRRDRRLAGDDFHGHVRSLLAGERPDLASFWALTPEAERLLNTADLYGTDVPREVKVRKSLVLQPSKAMRRRLEAYGVEPTTLRVKMESLQLALFMTGHGFAIARVALARADNAQLSAIELLEAQAAIGRFNTLVWRDAAGGVVETAAGLSLGGLVRVLALGASAQTRRSGRVAIYTYAKFAEASDVEARDEFATRLARHYTTDYAISDTIDGVCTIHDFETVRHAVCLEGAATVVAPSRVVMDVALLENFKTTSFRSHY